MAEEQAATPEPLAQATTPEPAVEAAPVPQAPIGRDEPITIEPEPEPEPAPPPAPSLTEEEVLQLKEKAASYDQISNDPQLSELIVSNLNARRGEPIHATTPEEPKANGDVVQENKQLQNTVAQLYSDVQVLAMMVQHPELKDPGTMKELQGFIAEYQLPIDKAFDLMQRTKAASTATEPTTPRFSSTEGGHEGGISQRPVSAAYQKQIANAKSSGGAVRAALMATLEERGQTE